jgi:putative protease
MTAVTLAEGGPARKPGCAMVLAMTAKPELLAPAGNMDCARAAVANGADAVYFGLPRFNARMRADNFTEEQLPELVRFLHEHRARAVCAFNTLVFTDELPEAERQLVLLDDIGVDAVLVQDLGLAVLARQLGVRFEVHASTQMTITSPAGVSFAHRLGIRRVVIARETSLRELAKFGDAGMELEAFVHGALCVAYSGQCLTSEALGQRSANRGECASACRLPYELIVNGAVTDLGDRRYLLSPQDLAAVREVPELIRLGVKAFKIEGRLKSPEYVAATCQVYRKAIDAALTTNESPITGDDYYKLEMTFSRGFTPGWLHGMNHQELVHGRFGTKRGPLIGHIKEVGHDYVAVEGHASAWPSSAEGRAEARLSVKPGDGVVFGETEQGGRVWEIKGDRLFFARGHIDFGRLTPGLPVWKTSDPQLERELRRTFAGVIPKPKTRLDITVTGAADHPLTLEAGGETVHSAMPLQTAFKRPLMTPVLRDHLGRLGDTDYELGEVHNQLVGQVILPVSELNRLRRELVGKLQKPEVRSQKSEVRIRKPEARTAVPVAVENRSHEPELVVLCRTMEQIGAAVAAGVGTVYVDFEDIRRYAEAVKVTRERGMKVLLATPRIEKAGEQAFFKTIEQAQPDGVLIRNLGGLEYFRNRQLQKIGDFSLNVANPVTAELLMGEGLDRVTMSYDLNAAQVLDLLRAAPPAWFEIVLHQHLPMFHMEHCVFAAFLSTGTDASNCGRPCDRHEVRLRDRVGAAHPVKADVGCRNTVFHARAQSGAEFLPEFLAAGARVFRVELLDEDAATVRAILESYRALLAGRLQPPELARRLRVATQLGVTSGTLTVLG